MNTTEFFDPATADTPEGLSPTVAYTDISGIPAQGTGLAGAAYVPGTRIWNIELARAAAAGPPGATFVTTEFGYGAKHSIATLQSPNFWTMTARRWRAIAILRWARRR